MPDVLTPSLPCSRAVNDLGFVTPEPTAAALQCSEHPACGSAGVGPPGTCTARPSSSQSLRGPAASAPGSHFGLDPCSLHIWTHLLLVRSCAVIPTPKRAEGLTLWVPRGVDKSWDRVAGIFLFSTPVKEMWLWTCSHLKLALNCRVLGRLADVALRFSVVSVHCCWWMAADGTSFVLAGYWRDCE